MEESKKKWLRIATSKSYVKFTTSAVIFTIKFIFAFIVGSNF